MAGASEELLRRGAVVWDADRITADDQLDSTVLAAAFGCVVRCPKGRAEPATSTAVAGYSGPATEHGPRACRRDADWIQLAKSSCVLRDDVQMGCAARMPRPRQLSLAQCRESCTPVSKRRRHLMMSPRALSRSLQTY